MRPLELTLEGFKSYRRPQSFTFEGRDLFGIVGPTGSGKSSILEGMIFALYGKTPSVPLNTKRLINSQEAQAKVQLVFEVDEVAWEVTRVIRVKGAPLITLRRLDGRGELLTNDRKVTEKVEEIVGLDFESFRSSVSLPQGEFDRFLKAAPAERSKILKGIFRLDRVDRLREAAQSTRMVVEAQMAALRRSLESLGESPEGELARLEAGHREASRRLDEVNDRLPEVREAEREVERSGAEISNLRQSRAVTEAALGKLPPEESLRNLSDEQDSAQRRLEEAKEALERSVKDLAGAESAEAAALDRTGGEQWLSAAESALKEHDRLAATRAEASAALEGLEAALDEQRVRLATAGERLAQAEEVSLEAARRLRALEQRHAAHLLRGELHEGAECPVCEQEVSRVPARTAVPALEGAEELVRRAEAELRSARAARESAEKQFALAEQRLKLAAEGAESAELRLGASAELLQVLAPGVADVASEVAARRRQLAEARSAVAAARSARDAADAQERRARSEKDLLTSSTGTITNQLVHTCGLLGLDPRLGSGEGLWEFAKQVMEAGAGRIEELSRRAAELEARVASAARMVEAFRVRFGAGADDHAIDVLARAKDEVLRLERRIEEIEKAIALRADQQEELAGLQDRKARYDRLVSDFTDSKFTAYLLDEQRRLLSRIGSEKFHELTGHYTFDDLGQFQVVDQRTGITRTPDTLSGGETFLAALSLALAMAEAVEREGGRLGCFFLDEGFGSLDQESLDLALDGIQSLAEESGRLIGLISHVSGVQARLEDLIVLERLPDGSTEVAQHEGPLGYASALV